MKGFVLLSTTFIIAIISLIVLTLANSLNIDLKIINQLTMRQKRLGELEDTAQEIIAKVSSKEYTDCYSDTPREFIDYSHVNKNGCRYVNGRFILEYLGEFTCVVVNAGQSSLATKHYNLYLINQYLSNHLLQVRFAIAGELTSCLQIQQRLINPGIISWVFWNHM